MPQQATPKDKGIHVLYEEKMIEIVESDPRDKGKDVVTCWDFYRQYKSNETFIETLDEPGSGGMHHWYRITEGDKGKEAEGNFWKTQVFFQKEPIKEAGVNGCQIEDMIFIALHRLKCAQRGPFPCDENEAAMGHLKAAIRELDARTKRRQNRGVEGTSIP